MINTDYRPTAEVLMESLADVEKVQRVVILMESEDNICIKTNCTLRELKWVLDQGAHCTMNELFGVRSEQDG